MNCTYCGGNKYHADWCPATDGDDDAMATKAARRQDEARRAGNHPVHGRGLEDIMKSISKRAAAVERRESR